MCLSRLIGPNAINPGPKKARTDGGLLHGRVRILAELSHLVLGLADRVAAALRAGREVDDHGVRGDLARHHGLA